MPKLGEVKTRGKYACAALALDLSLNPAHRAGIVGQMQRAALLAAPLLQFELPAEIEFAPAFAP